LTNDPWGVQTHQAVSGIKQDPPRGLEAARLGSPRGEADCQTKQSQQAARRR